MENVYQNIDELFRKRFEHFEPSPPDHVWPKILAKLHPGSGGSGMGKIILISGLSIIAVGTLLLFLAIPMSRHQNTLASDAFIENASPTGIEKTWIAEALPGPNPSDLLTPAKQVFNDQEIPSNTTIASSQNPETLHTPAQQSPTPIQQEDNPNTTKPRSFHSVLNLTMIKSPGLYTFNKTLPLEIRNGAKLKNYYPPEDDYRRKASPGSVFKLGASIHPEMAYFPSQTGSDGISFGLGLDMRYAISNFFVQTGLGLSFANEDGKYDVKFNEFLGSYQDVYNVIFDSTEQGVVPIYFTKTVEVYDTIDHLKVFKTRNAYTYLQIPLLFGYEWQKSRVSFSVKAGPCMSMLIHKNVPDPVLPENIRILSQQGNNSRIETSWQLMLGFGMSYSLNKNLEFAIDIPTFRYYLSSPIKGDKKHPYAFGLKAGILYKL